VSITTVVSAIVPQTQERKKLAKRKNKNVFLCPCGGGVLVQARLPYAVRARAVLRDLHLSIEHALPS
jgi:hypothetical protein